MAHHFFLSPHYDDAALSCGGAIAQLSALGETPVVVTIFGGKPDYDHLSPFAHAIHARPHGGADLIDVRRAEEREALAILGAQSIQLDFLDCIYRQDADRTRWLYASEEAIFGPVDAGDDALIDEFIRSLFTFVPEPAICQFIAPLAVGNHVDHQVIFRAARRLHGAGWAVLFYEDYPYVVRDAGGLKRTLARWQEDEQWSTEVATLSDRDLAVKVAAVCAYRSQLGVLFGSNGNGHASDVRPALSAFAAQVAITASHVGLAERFWRLQATAPRDQLTSENPVCT